MFIINVRRLFMNAHVAEYWLVLSLIAKRENRWMAQWFYHAQYELEADNASEDAR